MNKVSIVIPTYNSAPFIKESVESALGQNYSNKEIIVVDDGSTDNTREILFRYTKNKKIKCIHQKRSGAAAARNTGIRQATGEFVAFLDADDIWLPEKLEKQLPLFGDSEVGLVYSDMAFFGAESKFRVFSEMAGKFFKGQIVKQLLENNFIPTSSVVARKSEVDKAGGFNENLAIGEDYFLWLVIANLSKIDFVPEQLVMYRIHRDQISKSRKSSYKNLSKLYSLLLRDRWFSPYKNLIRWKFLENSVKSRLS